MRCQALTVAFHERRRRREPRPEHPGSARSPRAEPQKRARIADRPRAPWANLESGAATPTLSVLVKVAHALQVRLEELIEPPRRTGRLYKAATLPTRKRGDEAPARDHRRPRD